MPARITFSIPADLVDLAVRFLNEHSSVLLTQGFEASAHIVGNLAAEIQECVSLQTPQTAEEQARILTQVFGCGPDDESTGNKA